MPTEEELKNANKKNDHFVNPLAAFTGMLQEVPRVLKIKFAKMNAVVIICCLLLLAIVDRDDLIQMRLRM